MNSRARAKVLPFETKATRAAKSRRAKTQQTSEKEKLKRKVEELEARLRAAEGRTSLPEGLVVELTRFFANGLGSLSWDRVARILAAVHFSWHSDVTDEFVFSRVQFLTGQQRRVDASVGGCHDGLEQRAG